MRPHMPTNCLHHALSSGMRPPGLCWLLWLACCEIHRLAEASEAITATFSPIDEGSSLPLLRPVHLVFFQKPTELFEYDWLRAIFRLAGVPFTEHHYERTNNTLTIDIWWDSVLVMPFRLPEAPQLFEGFERKQIPFGAIHLSDENYQSDKSFYNMTLCSFVFRNYHHPYLNDLSAAPVEAFALGYKRDFWGNYNGTHPAHITHDDRPHAWSFVGAAHLFRLDRVLILHTFHDVKPHTYLLTHEFNAGVSVQEYRDVALRSKFMLCPIGQRNLDTFRLYEAMEAGAIPVAVSLSQEQPYMYWEGIFGVGSHEIPFVNNLTWDLNKAEVIALLNDPQAYERRRLQVLQFWYNYKARLALLMRHHVAQLQAKRPWPPDAAVASQS